jgi:hypothetical protein
VTKIFSSSGRSRKENETCMFPFIVTLPERKEICRLHILELKHSKEIRWRCRIFFDWNALRIIKRTRQRFLGKYDSVFTLCWLRWRHPYSIKITQRRSNMINSHIFYHKILCFTFTYAKIFPALYCFFYASLNLDANSQVNMFGC